MCNTEENCKLVGRKYASRFYICKTVKYMISYQGVNLFSLSNYQNNKRSNTYFCMKSRYFYIEKWSILYLYTIWCFVAEATLGWMIYLRDWISSKILDTKVYLTESFPLHCMLPSASDEENGIIYFNFFFVRKLILVPTSFCKHSNLERNFYTDWTSVLLFIIQTTNSGEHASQFMDEKLSFKRHFNSSLFFNACV